MQALRAFEAAARERSLSRAAESLSLTHGAISHQIKALEQDLGVRLVERAGRGIRLTDEGERFAIRVRAAFAELSSAVQEIAHRANPRRLRVTCTPSFGARWLLPRIGRFIAAHPDIDLDISATNALVDFDRDDMDVAIRYGFGQWPGLFSEHLTDDSFFPVCSPRIPGGVPKRPEDLARYTLLRADDEFWKPWFDVANVDLPEPARGPTYNDSSHLLQAAADGQGIALARRTLIGKDLRNGVLVRPFAIEVAAPRKFFLVCPPRMQKTAKFDAFRRWLHDEFAADDDSVCTLGKPAAPARTASAERETRLARRRR
jgi:LysR family glycine cleavage system transcriptional activator